MNDNRPLIYYPCTHSPLRCSDCGSCTQDYYCQLLDIEVRLDGGCEFWQPTDVPLSQRDAYIPPVFHSDAIPQEDPLAPLIEGAVEDSATFSGKWLETIIGHLGESDNYEEALEKLDKAFLLLSGSDLMSGGFGDRPTYSHVLGINDVVQETELPYRPEEGRQNMGQQTRGKKNKRRNPR